MFRRLTHINTFTLCLALASLSFVSALPIASARAQDYPEAIAVEDITYLGCVITEVVYEWNGEDNFDEPISETEESCPAGSVLRSFPTTVEEAEELGLPYVATTGVDAVDEAEVQALKSSMAPAIDAERAAMSQYGVAGAAPVRAYAFSSHCLALSRSRSVSYSAGYPDTGAKIKSTAYYFRSTDCTWYISRVKDYVYDPLTPGEDIYWDQLHYNASPFYANWDAGCRRMYDYGTYTTYTSGWEIFINNLFTDETINDTSFGCSWWGEEYNGSVFLYS